MAGAPSGTGAATGDTVGSDMPLLRLEPAAGRVSRTNIFPCKQDQCVASVGHGT